MKRNVTIRKFEYTDLDVLRKAYAAGSFDLPKMSELEFAAWVLLAEQKANELNIVDVNNIPIAFVAAKFDGYRYEPHMEIFKWATDRQIFEASLVYFTKLKERKDIGVIVIKSYDLVSKNYHEHLAKHGLMQYVGTIIKGDKRGDEYIYAATGNV